MRVRRPKRATRSELAAMADIDERSAFELLDGGMAQRVDREDYPEPLRRFLERERVMVHVKLSAVAKRRLDERSRRSGVPVDELARRWIEQGIRRDAV